MRLIRRLPVLQKNVTKVGVWRTGKQRLMWAHLTLANIISQTPRRILAALSGHHLGCQCLYHAEFHASTKGGWVLPCCVHGPEHTAVTGVPERWGYIPHRPSCKELVREPAETIECLQSCWSWLRWMLPELPMGHCARNLVGWRYLSQNSSKATKVAFARVIMVVTGMPFLLCVARCV